MRAIANHFRIQFKYLMDNPVFIPGLIFIALIFLIPVLPNKSYLNSFIWPCLITPESLTLSFSREMGRAIGLLYSLSMYSLIPMAMIKTFPSNNNTTDIYGGAFPTLPISFRGRAVSESLLVMCILFALRATTQFFVTSLDFSEILIQTMLGVLIIFPVSLSFSTPYFKGLMPFFIISLVFVAVKLGFLAEPVSYIITCFVFSLFVYLSLAWQIPTFNLIRFKKHRISKLYRTPLSPEKQYLHDWWAFPLKANLVWVLVFAILFCLTLFLMLIDIINYKFTFGFAHVCAISLGLIFAIRPFGLDVTSLHDNTTKSPFAKIWYILPIRKHVMLRGMFFHVILWATVSCILFSFASLAGSIYKSGGFNLFLQEFNWGKLVILNVFYFVPCAASFFVNIVTDSTSGIVISSLVFVALLIIFVLIYFSNVSLILAITAPMLISAMSLQLCIPKLKANQ